MVQQQHIVKNKAVGLMSVTQYYQLPQALVYAKKQTGNGKGPTQPTVRLAHYQIGCKYQDEQDGQAYFGHKKPKACADIA
jgi:hypothetical protein